MPEGDTIHHAARQIGGALLGREIVSIETPNPRHAMDRWPELLGGRALRAVDAYGKHLYLRFDNDLTLHSHLRMTGKWGVYERGRRWSRSAQRAWLVIRTSEHEVVQFDGPLLELVPDSRTRVTRLGPDILGEHFDEQRYLRLLREDDQTRQIGDALLDQRNVAGIGNVWKAEACFLARVDPWRRTRDVSDEEALRIVRAIRPLMRQAAERGRFPYRSDVYNRVNMPCRRCGTRIRSRGQGDDNRTTYWCPGCQR